MTHPSSLIRTIGIFDSGVGGLSVLKAIRKKHPSINFIYIADSGYAPYGSRSAVIVIACNTATAIAVAKLRATLTVPIIALEPAIKPAVALTKTKVIGVLATERTIESQTVARLCAEFGHGVNILLQPCPGLVERVERGELSSDGTYEYLRKLICPLLAQHADTLVLGCTHYVFLKSAIQKIAGPDVHIIESSAAVARQTMRYLNIDKPNSLNEPTGNEVFMTTGSPEHAQTLFSQLWGSPVKVLALDNPVAP